MRQGINEGVLEGSQRALFVAASIAFLDHDARRLGADVVRTRATRAAPRSGCSCALRIRIFAHLQRLALDFYDREMAGRIMTRMTTDVDTLSNLLQTGLINALVSVLSFVGVLVVLLRPQPGSSRSRCSRIMPPLIFLDRLVPPPLGPRVRARRATRSPR